MGYWVLYFFLAVGAKLLLALVMIYYILPRERTCAECDEPTLLLGAGRSGRLRRLVSFGQVQWRWCPRCGWEGMTRRVPDDLQFDSETTSRTPIER